MIVRISPDGELTMIYTECINFADVGQVHIARASHVEPTSTGEWIADLGPVNGPLLGPFTRRSEALAAEAHWLEKWLGG